MPKPALCLIALAFLASTASLPAQNANPPIYSEVIPISSALPYNPAIDAQRSFAAPNGQTVEVLVKGPIGSGTYSRAIRPGEAPDAYFPAVVAEAVKAGAHHLVIPKGVYAFRGPALCSDPTSAACNQPSSCNANQYYNCPPHWTIGQYPQGQVTVPNSITDLDIDFSGSELDFAAPILGIWILEAQRIKLENLILDWPSLPIASLGTIVRDPDNPGHNALVIDPGYPVKDRYQGPSSSGGGPVQIQAVDPWDESTTDPPGTFDPESNNYFETYFIFGGATQPTYVGKTSAGVQTFSCTSCHFQNSAADPSCSIFAGCANFDNFTPGERVIVRHYTYNGFAVLVNWSNDIQFDNVQLRTGPGIGFGLGNEGGYHGYRLANSQIKRGPGRLISTASDAINLGLNTDLILEDNEVAFQGDDSVNIHSTTAVVTGVATGVINGKAATQITTPEVCSPDPMDQPILGDTLAFFDADYIYRGTAKVVAASGTFCGTSLTLTLDHPVAGLAASDNLLDLTQQAMARYIVRDNIMHQCRCHGVFVNAPYGSIQNNLMYGNSQGGIQLAGGNGYGPGSTNLAITDNLISDPGQAAQFYGAITLVAADAQGNILPKRAFEKIRMTNNVFSNMVGPAIVAGSMRYFTIGPNAVLNTNQVKTAPLVFGSQSSLDSILIDLSSDGNVCGTYTTGTSGPVGVTPSGNGVLVAPYCDAN